MTLKVKGFKEATKKAGRVLAGLKEPTKLINAMRMITMAVTRDAKKTPPMPVDTGRLRSSITPSVTTTKDSIRGIVGSNVEYAPYQEFGTRRGVPARRYLGTAFQGRLDYARKKIAEAYGKIMKGK